MSNTIKRKTNIFFAVLFCFTAVFEINAQEQSCSGQVLSAADSTIISYATIRSGSQVESSNEEGRFTTSIGDSVIFYHIGFETLVLHPKKCNELTTVYLQPLSVKINDIVISPDRVIREIEQDKSFRIKSFGILSQDHLIVHSKAYLSQEHRLQLFDNNGILLSELDIKADIEEMLETCDGQICIRDDMYVYYIGYADEGIVIEHKQELSDFMKRYGHCVQARHNEMIFKLTRSNNLITDFFIVTKDRGTLHLAQIKDEELLSGLSKDKGVIRYSKTGNPSGLGLVDLQKDPIELLFLGDFLNEVMYNNQYGHNYVFAKDSNYFVFNYQLDSLHIYNQAGDSVGDYHFDYDPPQSMFMNYEQEKIFSLSKDGLDDHTLYIFNDERQFEKVLTIESSHISDIAVVKNKVFYLRRSNNNGNKHAVLCFEDLNGIN